MQFAQEPRILHRDDRLRRDVLEECDLLLGKRADLAAVSRDSAEQRSVFTEGHKKCGPKALRGSGLRSWEAAWIVGQFAHIGDLDDGLAADQPG